MVAYLILQIDPGYVPPETENREIFGVTLQQQRNTAVITRETFGNVVTAPKQVPDDVLETLMVATVALKYTQSNSVCVAYDGQVIGMGAGQQSRIHCTRLACEKADTWFLQQHPRVLGAQFQRGVKRVDKFNLIDQYLIWEQLSQTEEAAMLAGFSSPPEPLTGPERAAWIEQYQRYLPQLRCLHPVSGQCRSGQPQSCAVHCPDRRGLTRRRGDRRGRAVRHDDDADGAATVLALTSTATGVAAPRGSRVTGCQPPCRSGAA